MEDILKNLKSLFSWVWKPAKTPEEKAIKRYDALIALCVMFMIGYVCLFFFNLDRKTSANNTVVDSPNNIVATNPNYNISIYNAPDTQLRPFYTTNALTDGEFYVGEIVGVKYFGVFGLVREKVLGTRGYSYVIRYENTEHDLMNESCFAWELYRPPAGSVPLTVLRP
jgi:hypothetical protein